MKCVNSSGVVMWSLVIWPFLWGIMQNCELFSKLTLHTPGGDMMRKSMIQMLTSTSCSNTGPPRLVQTLTSTSCSNIQSFWCALRYLCHVTWTEKLDWLKVTWLEILMFTTVLAISFVCAFIVFFLLKGIYMDIDPSCIRYFSEHLILVYVN